MAATNTSPTAQRGSRSYPTTPPPLTRGDLADLGSRRRAASRQLEEAEAKRERDTGRVDSRFELFRQQLDNETGDRRSQAREQTAARGLAMSPRGLGRELRTIRDWQAGELAEGEATRADQLAAIDEAVRQARTNRDIEHMHVDADEARRRTELDRLIRSVGF